MDRRLVIIWNMRHLPGLFLPFAALLAVSCAPIDSEPIELEIGVVEEGHFRSFAPGDALAIGPTPNGSFYSTPLIRVLGLECETLWETTSTCLTDASIVTDDGQLVGAIHDLFPHTALQPAADGWQEGYLPISVPVQPGGVVDPTDVLAGQSATLDVVLHGVDDRSTPALSIAVELIAGPVQAIGPGT